MQTADPAAGNQPFNLCFARVIDETVVPLLSMVRA